MSKIVNVEQGTLIVKNKRGAFMILPNDTFGHHLSTQEEYEPWFYKLVINILKPGDKCIDCGSNLGYHTVTMGNLVGPTGEILAIEPQRIIFQQATGNVFLNDLRNVTTFNVALGDKEDWVEMEPIDINALGVNMGANYVGKGGERVRMTQLDSLVPDNKMIHFIKIDVQGCEIKLLDGAKKLLERCRPIMFVEVEHMWLEKHGSTGEDLLEKLRNLNYTLHHIGFGSQDYLCVPNEKADLLPHYIKDLQ